MSSPTPLCALLAALPSDMCVFVGDDEALHILRGTMEVTAVSFSPDLVEIRYEHEPRQITRVQLPVAQAVELVINLFQRDKLTKVEIPKPRR